MAVVASEGENQAEILRVRDGLNSNYADERKTAARTAISLMRSGENVHVLFSDMLKCAKTDDLELKKLIYLYLVNYSSQEQEQAIMCVNLFVNDCIDQNPLVRALAVRTMCRIRLETVAEYIVVPLKQCLRDADPYVRKTASFGVAKLFGIIPDTVEGSGLFPDLIALIHDENPMVVANTTAAIFEINEKRSTPLFRLNLTTMSPILAAIASCSDWCQAMFLDSIARYVPESSEDASFLIDRLIPMLKNSNPSVVVSAFKCIFLFLEFDGRNPSTVFAQVIPPFITLVTSAECEIQYVVLRTLSLFVQKYPRSLAKEIRVFFCKYNEPPYVKLDKLNIMVTICNEFTAEIVLDELAEYCNQVDVEFVRKAVKCVGQIAIKIDSATGRCIDILVGLVASKAEYTVEEAVVVVTDVLRRFPGKFESVIAAVCRNFDQIKESRAKSAAVWILGEYCRIIENVDVLLDPFLDTFHDEPPCVQLQLLTALVKIYLERPAVSKDQLQFILNEATKGDTIPDVRNRAFIYWRLLSTSPEVTQKVIKFDKQMVVHSGVQYDDSVLSELIRSMGSVAGVLHIVPSDFVKQSMQAAKEEEFGGPDRTWQRLAIRDDQGLFELWIDWDIGTLYLKIVNNSSSTLKEFALAVNVNPIGLAFPSPPVFPAEIGAGASGEVEAAIVFQNGKIANFESPNIDLALKTNIATVFASATIPIEVLTLTQGKIGAADFKARFPSLPARDSVTMPRRSVADEDILKNRNVFVVGRRDNRAYISLMIPPNELVLVETVDDGAGVTAQFKCLDARVIPFIKIALPRLLLQPEAL
jgi:vesicle coat complex subunit